MISATTAIRSRYGETDVRFVPAETLYLPRPGTAFRHCRHADLSPRGVPWHTVVRCPPPVGEPVPLAQYRWLVGHQLVFCAWQWLAEALQTLADSRAPDDSAISTAAALYDGYSVLLLYCGSCSPAVYGEAIRPQMMRADPAFSGRWARDYEYVVPLLPTVRRVLPPDLLEPLTAAVKSNRVVHMAVADRLVPDGESLLRESGQDTNAPPTRAQRDIFDGFFRVTRMPLCRNEFRAQLCTRIGQVRSDLTRNPLPVPCGWENTRDTYTAAVDRFHRDGVAILNRLERLIDEPT